MPDAHHTARRDCVQAKAFTALRKLLQGAAISDDELVAFLLSIDTDAARKDAVNAMLDRECITPDQGAFAFYLHPSMRGA